MEYLEGVTIQGLWRETPPNRVEFEMLSSTGGIISLFSALTNLHNPDIQGLFSHRFLHGRAFSVYSEFRDALRSAIEAELSHNGFIAINFPTIHPLDPESYTHIVEILVRRHPHVPELPDIDKVQINTHAVSDPVAVQAIKDIHGIVTQRALEDKARFF